MVVISDPQTTNVLLSIPSHGTDVNTWDTPLNGDFTAIDGFLGGIQQIAVGASPITLTSPPGTPTPGAGPTQAQNCVLRFSGTLTANVVVSLPLPGSYIIDNSSTGNFLLTFTALSAPGGSQIVCIDQGDTQRVYCDGTNVRFINAGRIGHVEIWAGLTAMPAWVTNSVPVNPYLLCDGSIYNFSTYPYLGKRLGSSFGGNGITTFGVPDLRGRIPLNYDGTATRITSAGCGLNGQTLGAVLDQQNIQLSLSQIPTGLTVTGTVTVNLGGGSGNYVPYASSAAWSTAPGTSSGSLFYPTTGPVNLIAFGNSFSGFNTLTSNNTGGTAHPNVQPSQVTGISVIRAA